MCVCLCRPGFHYTPIWLTDVKSASSDKCLIFRNTCPSTSVTSCTHSEDVTVECSKYNYFKIDESCINLFIAKNASSTNLIQTCSGIIVVYNEITH